MNTASRIGRPSGSGENGIAISASGTAAPLFDSRGKGIMAPDPWRCDANRPGFRPAVVAIPAQPRKSCNRAPACNRTAGCLLDLSWRSAHRPVFFTHGVADSRGTTNGFRLPVKRISPCAGFSQDGGTKRSDLGGIRMHGSSDSTMFRR